MSFKIHELGEEERYNRENRAVPTSPFRRKVNFSEENFWCYCSSWYSWIINCQLDQTPLSYVSPGKYIFVVKGVKTLKGIDDKRQITARFAASMSGESLPIQVIYEGKTRRYLSTLRRYLSTLFLRISTQHFLEIAGPTRKRPLAF